jgi:hypothetical protein
VRTLIRTLVAAFFVFTCTSQYAVAASRYDPRLHFRSIETARFTIHFHQGEESLARRLAAIAEETADRVAAELGAANGRVHVILVDQHDLSNGWANPVPYNVIEISAAAPSGGSTIGNTDDWLRLCCRMSTHIVHLTARGWTAGFARLGHSPPLSNVFPLQWQIEGIAVSTKPLTGGDGYQPVI